MSAHERTNADRADSAHIALRAYSADTRHDGSEIRDQEEMAEVLGDLLCDLHHLADSRGLKWGELTERGEMHHTHEVDSEYEDMIADRERGQE